MSLSALKPLMVASVAALGAVLLGPAPAQASPACDDAVVGALHAVHDTTGDPAGLVHEAEETYCTVAP